MKKKWGGGGETTWVKDKIITGYRMNTEQPRVIEKANK